MASAVDLGRGKKLTGALKFFLANAGKDLQWLAKVRAETGANVPTLDRLPTIQPAYRWLWEAYNTLAARRIETERGPQPIQISEIEALARLYALDAGMTGDLLTVVLALDGVYIEHTHKRRPAPPPQGRRGRPTAPGKPAPQRVPLVPAKRR